MRSLDFVASSGRTKNAAMRRAERGTRDWWRRIGAEHLPRIRALDAQPKPHWHKDAWRVLIETVTRG